MASAVSTPAVKGLGAISSENLRGMSYARSSISGARVVAAVPATRKHVSSGALTCRCSTAEILHDGAKDPLLMRVARGEGS